MRTIQDIVSRLDQVKEYERYYSALCIFHPDTNPSMLVYKDGWFRCLSCGRTGDLYTLDRKLSGWNAPSYSKRKEPCCWTAPKKAYYPEIFVNSAHETLVKNSESLGWYLRIRKLEDRIEPQRLGWSQGWYVIPTYSGDDGLTGYVLRAGAHIQETTGFRYITHSTSSLYVPDWYLFRKCDYVVVTFGVLDALTLAQLRIPACSTMWGTTLRIDEFDDVRKPILFFPDSGEEEKAVSYYRKLGWRGRIVRMDWPDGMKDANDLHMAGKDVEIMNAIEEAK